jgi:putative NADH-flavin reductase
MQRILIRIMVGAALLGAILTGATTAHAATAAHPLKITVFGGTGNIGRRIVAEALSRGHQVTVVARHPEELKIQGSGLAVARGDITDNPETARLIGGQDVVIDAISAGRGAGFEGNDILLQAAQSLVAGMRAAGPKAPRLIVVGGASTLMSPSGGAAATSPAAPAGSPQQQQQQVLDYLRGVKDVSWTYFSPAMQITPGTRTGKFRLGDDQLVRDASGSSRISMEDYAVATIDEAERAVHLRQRFTVGY